MLGLNLGLHVYEDVCGMLHGRVNIILKAHAHFLSRSRVDGGGGYLFKLVLPNFT